jgi:tetratricopeptide (TPR) repeat protein
MNKDKLLIGIGGLIAGIVIGFMIANTLNRSASTSNDRMTTSNPDVSLNSNLPPNHPPLPARDDGSQTGALPEVTEAIDKAKREPENFEAQMTAGDLYYQIQRFDEAAAFYEKANRLRPGDNEPLLKLGNTHFDAEQYEEAERWYSAVLKKTPNDVNVRTDLGLTFFLRTPRDIDRAIKEYNAALAIQPDNEIALQNLALAFVEKNDSDNLRKTLDRLSQVSPNNPVLLRHRPK